jgi:hypothetical protein
MCVLQGAVNKAPSEKSCIKICTLQTVIIGLACLDEKLLTWIKLNINAPEYFDCCLKTMVPIIYWQQ